MKPKKSDGIQAVSSLMEKVVLLLGRRGFLVFMVGLSACVKPLDYRSVLKENVVSKSVIDFSAEYLYVPSTGATSLTVAGPTIPFMLGDEKIVKLELTKEALRAYQVEMDPNYQGNPQNRSLVFEIPVSHVEYHCQEDRFRNCRNQEEENTQISWNERSQFKPDFSRVNITEVNFLPESIDRLLGGLSCMTEVSRKTLGYEFKNDHINFRIERAMVNDLRCGKIINFLSDLSSSVVSNYSLVKLNSMTTRNYRSMNYPRMDEGVFGFFKTEREFTDADNLKREEQRVRYMNRWNPNRGELVYYLSDEFNKPGNELLKKAAYDTVDRVNDGLAIAGVQFRLKLKEPEGINTGDMRYNMIILVEDPVGGLLGYGPSIVHPRTGEILVGRTVMFSGTLRHSAYGMYEEIREQRKRNAEAKKAVDGGTKKSDQAANEGDGGKKEALSGKSMANFEEYLLTLKGQNKTSPSPGVFTGTEDRGSPWENDRSKKPLTNSRAVEKVLAKAMSKASAGSKGGRGKSSDSIDILMARRHSCLLQFKEEGQTGYVSPRILKAIDGKFGSGELKKWEELSATEKQFVLDLIMPEAFAGILIHELGHNLGLRHNFKGSQDKENFYTKEELAEKGIDHLINSSSVMEYYDSYGLHDLPIFGKYDIAALRFGYQRQMTKKDGKSHLQIEGTLEEKVGPNVSKEEISEKLYLKDFLYCSDEEVAGSLGCKPFDSGTTYTEMADSAIQRYKHYVNRASLRHKRVDFNILDGSERYAKAIDGLFHEMRSFMEAMEKLKYFLNVSYEDDIWKEGGFADIKQAVIKAGEFLIDDVLIVPDLTCLLEDPKRELISVPISLLGKVSCSDVTWKEGYEYLGEMGRLFNDGKEASSKNPYVDQIDIRGSWIDKVLAAKYLFARRLQEEKSDEWSIFDHNTDNFMDLPELKEDLAKVLRLVMSDDLAVSHDVTRSKKVYKMAIPLRISQTHKIPQQLSSSLVHFLKIPVDREINFIEVLGRQIVRQEKSSDGRDFLAARTLESVGVYRTSDVLESLVPEALSVVFDGTKYAASKGNLVAFDLLSTYIAHESTEEAIKFLLRLNETNPITADTVRGFLELINEVRKGLASIDSLSHPFQIKMARLNDHHFQSIVMFYFGFILNPRGGGNLIERMNYARDVLDSNIPSIKTETKQNLDWLPNLKKK